MAMFKITNLQSIYHTSGIYILLQYQLWLAQLQWLINHDLVLHNYSHMEEHEQNNITLTVQG
jgi:hypothetical protein